MPKSKYLQLVQSAIVIQAICRGMLSRRRTIRLHKTLFRVQDIVRKLNRKEELKRLPTIPASSAGSDIFVTPMKRSRPGTRCMTKRPLDSPRRHLPSDFRLTDHPRVTECKSVYTRLSPYCMRLLIKARWEDELLDQMRGKLHQVIKAQSVVRQYLARCSRTRAVERKRLDIPDSLPPPTSLPDLHNLCKHMDSKLKIFYNAESVLKRWQKRLNGIVTFQAHVRGALTRIRMMHRLAEEVREQAISFFLHQETKPKSGHRQSPTPVPMRLISQSKAPADRNLGSGQEFSGYWW